MCTSILYLSYKVHFGSFSFFFFSIWFFFLFKKILLQWKHNHCFISLFIGFASFLFDGALHSKVYSHENKVLRNWHQCDLRVQRVPVCRADKLDPITHMKIDYRLFDFRDQYTCKTCNYYCLQNERRKYKACKSMATKTKLTPTIFPL